MKRTERAKVRAGALEGKIGADTSTMSFADATCSYYGLEWFPCCDVFLVTTAERCQINAAPSGVK